MAAPMTREEVAAQLQARTEAIQQRLQALQQEMTGTGKAVRKAVLQRPLVTVGLTVLAGFVVGRLLGGGRRTRTGGGVILGAALNADHVAAAVRCALEAGHDPAEAARTAAQPPPAAFLLPAAPGRRRGLFGWVLDSALQGLIGLGLGAALRYLEARFLREPGPPPSQPTDTP